jgi:acetyl-CoA acyltransferase 1
MPRGAGVTSENVAAKFGIDRRTQDELAVRSHARALAAQKAGRFKAEIVPVATVWKDPKTGEEKRIVVDADDGVREGVSIGALSKLRPVFKKDGSTTAGNSSQVAAFVARAVV